MNTGFWVKLYFNILTILSIEVILGKDKETSCISAVSPLFVAIIVKSKLSPTTTFDADNLAAVITGWGFISDDDKKYNCGIMNIESEY